jgi:hypothetical protein
MGCEQLPVSFSLRRLMISVEHLITSCMFNYSRFYTAININWGGKIKREHGVPKGTVLPLNYQ